MTEAFDKIIDVIEEHWRDNFEVSAIRVDEDTMNNLLKDDDFIGATHSEFDIDTSKYDGLVANKFIIYDDSISEPVADDVKLK